MKRVEFVVGLGFDKDNKPIHDFETRLKEALHSAAIVFGGFSVSYGSGGWISPTNGLVMEPNVSIVTLTDKDQETIEAFATLLRITFNQESVLVSQIDAMVRFV